jgi:hypothetical protein
LYEPSFQNLHLASHTHLKFKPPENEVRERRQNKTKNGWISFLSHRDKGQISQNNEDTCALICKIICTEFDILKWKKSIKCSFVQNTHRNGISRYKSLRASAVEGIVRKKLQIVFWYILSNSTTLILCQNKSSGTMEIASLNFNYRKRLRHTSLATKKKTIW